MRALGCIAAVLVASLVGLGAAGCGLMRALTPLEAVDAYPQSGVTPEAAEAPHHPDGAKLSALFVLGQRGSEIYDLLAPYEVLASSGAFDIATVAATRSPAPLTGRAAVLPDYRFEEAPAADLIVVPAVVDPNEAALLAFLRERGPQAQMVLSICEGARAVVRSGLLDDRRAVTHFFATDSLNQEFASTEFVTGHRYVWSPPVLSSAGVSAALDASLEALALLVGEETAHATADRLGAQWQREADLAGNRPNQGAHAIGLRDARTLLGNYLRPWGQLDVGLWLGDAPSELAIASVLDALPRTLSARVRIAGARSPIVTRHGLRLLVPSADRDGKAPDAVVALGDDAGDERIWNAARRIAIDESQPGSALLEVLSLIEREFGQATLRSVATMLEVPPSQVQQIQQVDQIHQTDDLTHP